ncbi:MAG TPA: MraY family glycosyltransferase [Solirubrobacteraceae bacterium]|nr:MraY family glycosyltransferase [Solirubrobacteraceae bacterium]
MSVADAIFAFLLAAAITAILTPFTARLALAVGAVDEPRERGLAMRATPLLGGLAIFAGAATAGLLWLPGTGLWHGVLIAAAVITAMGALDDRFDLSPAWKLAGQTVAAFIAVRSGVVVHHITLPFVGSLDFPHTGAAITLVGLVGLMNIVNFSDGVDGLAAGVSAIIALALAFIAFDLHRDAPGVLAALTAGSAVGFLVHNFPPARSFMGDCGSNLLGLLMGCVTVEAAVKTEVVVSFALPLVLLAVPFLDTTFVVLKRLKYRRPIYEADTEHFHHRMARIGFSQRRTVAYLYAWTGLLAGLALALRFVPYSDHHGHLHAGWALVMALLTLGVGAASVYLVYVLEILKFRRLTARRLRRVEPEVSEAEIEARVTEELETGEFQAVDGPSPPNSRGWPALRRRSGRTSAGRR